METKAKMNLWKSLVREWSGCQACKIGERADNHVFGSGFLPTDVLFVGEGPGKSEDAIGEPFVGPAGKILDYAREDSGLIKFKSFKTNLVACRPCDELAGPNRAPTDREIKNCEPRFIRTISIASPKVIVALGKLPSFYLAELKLKQKLFKLYHPAYILRQGGRGSDAYQDYVESMVDVKEYLCGL